MHDIYKLI